MKTPAQKLLGTTLPSGWRVTSYVTKDPQHTGGNFSIGYLAESEAGEKGFLKALDFMRIIGPGTVDPVSKMRQFTEAFEFERDLLRQCKQSNMNRIIRLLDDGAVIVDETQVPYLIFELAQTDLRRLYHATDNLDVAMTLRTMHNVAVAIQQLHGKEIAHQDIKPSNVLFVQNRRQKLGDFGRSATRECRLPHVSFAVAGDRNHAPPEGLYGYIHPEWKIRRYGTDAYQLGSLFVFMLTGSTMTGLLVEALHEQHRPNRWAEGYEQVLPYLQEAFRDIIAYVRQFVPEAIEEEVSLIIRELCDPDINRRGDTRKKLSGANPFMMERFVSRFDRLATSLECNLVKGHS